MKYLLPLLFMFSCSNTFYVTDTKIFKEQYLCVDCFTHPDMTRVKSDFKKAGFKLEYLYSTRINCIKQYMVLTPEMIEYTKKNGKGILKKRHIKQLKNTL